MRVSSLMRGAKRSQVEFFKTATKLWFSLLVAVTLFFAPQLCAQANYSTPSRSASPSVLPAMSTDGHFTWIEQFGGSANSQGQVMILDSSAGYVFGPHLLVDAGVPVYFVRADTTTTTGTSTTNSVNGLGDVYAQVRLSFANPAVNFKTQLTGRAPTGSTSDGISTGHATYDWTNRFDRDFGRWTPFAEIGLADSLPDSFAYRRAFASYGELAHFQAGTEYRVANSVSVAASAFYVAPWRTQTIDSRIVRSGSGTPTGHQTTGGSSLAADNGFSAGVTLSPVRAVDFSIGYVRSTHYALNTVSFGVTVNMRALLLHSHL